MNILTFDVEEWFHLLELSEVGKSASWSKFPERIRGNMSRIFDILDQTETPATFFVIGWVAENYPDIVKEIVRRGWEVGFHTSEHKMVSHQTPSEFQSELHTGLDKLEQITSQKVTSFRAPGFSITPSEKWAFEILVQEDITTDSSVFPANHAHGGFINFEPRPSIIHTPSGILREFPISTAKFMGKRFIYSGGGYFRLLPYSAIKRFTRNSDYVMAYIHPRDLDANQPVLEGLSAARRFRSYVGLKTATAKLIRWLTDFKFADLREANKHYF